MPETPESTPLVYLILGSAGSGRREILADLLEGGLEPSETAALLVSESETPSAGADRIAARAKVGSWTWIPGEPGAEGSIEADVPPDAQRLFFLTDGRANPVDQIEAFKRWIEAKGLELARVLCVVDCRLAETNPPLVAWFGACIHFADVVLLNHREGVSNKWMSDFQGRFKREHFPCLFETVKGGAVRNPALILEPQALRISHVFDEDQDWNVLDAEGKAVDDEGDSDEEGQEEVELQVEQDPYFERRMGGRRVKELPDIAKYL